MAPAPAKIADQLEIVPANFFAPLDLVAIYGCAAPVEVDLGCGDGSFLVAAAEANPDRNFLGVERLVGRVRSACRKIELSGVNNARILRCEISYAVSEMLPEKSVEFFHLMFPDPWPKRRHSRRRIFTEDFLVAIYRALVPGGTLRIATDEIDYFREIERLAARSLDFVRVSNSPEPASASTFEKRFKEDQIEIYRLMLRKVSSSRNEVASQ